MMWTSINHQRQNLKKWSALYQITLLVHPGQQAVASPYIIPVYKGSTFHNNPMMTRNLSSQRVFIKSIAQLLPQHEQIIGLPQGCVCQRAELLKIQATLRELLIPKVSYSTCHYQESMSLMSFLAPGTSPKRKYPHPLPLFLPAFTLQDILPLRSHTYTSSCDVIHTSRWRCSWPSNAFVVSFSFFCVFLLNTGCHVE